MAKEKGSDKQMTVAQRARLQARLKREQLEARLEEIRTARAPAGPG